jgi:3-oxoacyl-[acyl-carrier protein] reductase
VATEFAGKTALVTGASRGIGAATAIALARQGVARILVHYNSYREGAEQVLEAVRQAGADGQLLGGDLALDGGIWNVADRIREEGDVGILVNNAGSLIQRATLAEFTDDLYERVMRLNVKSAWFLAQAALPGMLARGEGIIVNVSSIGARNGGGPGATIYAAAKGAILTMTRGMAKELAPKGIRVNAISPGTVDNYFHEQFSTREMLESVIRMTPAGRLATNEDMADAIVFLCSRQASYIHGQTIEINGGMFAP